jgi:hypothetical protein
MPMMRFWPYRKTITWSGSGASLAVAIDGVRARDRVVGQFRVAPTQAVTIRSITPTANTVTITLSGANTSNDAQIDILVYR